MSELLNPIREIHHIGNDTPEQLVRDMGLPGLVSRGISVLGISNAGADYRMSRLDPPFHHVLACFGGHGWIRVDSVWQRCKEGCAYISPAHAPMAFQTDGRHRWRFAWVYLIPDVWPMTQRAPFMTSTDPRQLVAAMEGLYREDTATPRDAQLVDAWCQLAAGHTRRILSPHGQADPLWRLWAAVDARLSEPWTLQMLSDECAIAPEALRRLCQRTIGLSPMRQVTELRMRRAQTLLESTPSKIYAVAKNVGYHNVFAFSVAFKRWSGKSPTDCRPAV